MVKKPAALGPDLLSKKGAAAAVSGAPQRSAPAPIAEELVPLNFRVPASLRREFKVYAATHDISGVEVLKRGFEALKKQRP
ncbi:MAG: hypothetical protein HQL39_03835 [Alphaproteobacteria bacterium]|nr:hypothetical protein [Alphaproteobacteria bacterium]